MINCVTCGVKKPDKDFNWRWKALGIRQKSRRECQHGHQARFYQNHIEAEKERTRQRKARSRDEARTFVYQYLFSHPCVDCGERDLTVLEFNHIKGKAANINRLISEGRRSRVSRSRLR